MRKISKSFYMITFTNTTPLITLSSHKNKRNIGKRRKLNITYTSKTTAPGRTVNKFNVLN